MHVFAIIIVIAVVVLVVVVNINKNEHFRKLWVCLWVSLSFLFLVSALIKTMSVWPIRGGVDCRLVVFSDRAQALAKLLTLEALDNTCNATQHQAPLHKTIG